ncbi:MAG: ABC transporter ATP-binding protein [Spirochaetales bacterium]|jgi:ABC-type nitrate/sulfonate/bicarbonate transport system ATPase subunit|nr:ABC transporter ATP-binding protein [Spirochaetales bacterium]
MPDEAGVQIRVQEVVKSFTRTDFDSPLVVLDNLCFSIERGRFVSIIGESGCGKTTLLRMIAGLDFPSKGCVYRDNVKVTALDSKCGMMFQQTLLFPFLTVYENVAFGPRMLKKYDPRQIRGLLQLVRVEEFSNAYPNHLSGGMRQRVSLARALANEPDILLLDEPLGALDALTRMKLQDELVTIWQKRKNTMIMVTHDIDEAVFLSDTIIILSPRPAHIEETLSLDIPYPRNRSDPRFIAARNRILEILQYAGDFR